MEVALASFSESDSSGPEDKGEEDDVIIVEELTHLKMMVPKLQQEIQELKKEIEILSKKSKQNYSQVEISSSNYTPGNYTSIFSITAPTSGDFLFEWSFLAITIKPHLRFHWGLQMGSQRIITVHFQDHSNWQPIIGRLVVTLKQDDIVSILIQNSDTSPGSRAKQFFLKLTKIK